MFGTCDIMKLQSTAKCLSQQQTQGQSWVAAACQQHPLPSCCPCTSAAPATWWQPPPAAACAQLPSHIPNQKMILCGDEAGLRSSHLCHAHKTHLARSPGTASVAVVTSTHLPHRQTDTSVCPSGTASEGALGALVLAGTARPQQERSISEGSEERRGGQGCWDPRSSSRTAAGSQGSPTHPSCLVVPFLFFSN